MSIFDISEAIGTYLAKWKGKKIAIYPFGKYGVKTKEILNCQYNIHESIIVDNGLAHLDPWTISLDEVNDCSAYIWFLTCENPCFHKEILNSIRHYAVPEEQIIDLFKDSLYTDEYRLLSKLGTKDTMTVSSPCGEFAELVKKKKNENRRIVIGEIGVGCGATAVEVCRLLAEDDVYMCFDFQDIVNDLLYDLDMLPNINCKLIGKGNSRRLYDSYNWNLSNLLFEMRNDNLNGIFDVVYLDGAHSFMHDAVACCLLKELLKPNGYIVFDDVFWTYSSNENLVHMLKELYTAEQLEDCQVNRVLNTFMIEDKHFEQIYMSQVVNPQRAVYRKRVCDGHVLI